MNKTELIEHLRQQGFSEKILNAFEKVERKKFVIKELKSHSYEDTALPIGYGQTISQPYTIGFMLNILDVKDKQKILEVGSGSGYVLALLAEMNPNGKIYGIERIAELVESSKEKLKDYKNVKVFYGDGSKRLLEEKPFDRILVSASARDIPQKLVEQLKNNGVLVSSVRYSIIRVKKQKPKNEIKEYPGFVFVPLIEE